MEHSTSAVNWQPVNPAKAPGQTDPRQPRPRGPRRRHHRLLPVAPVARRAPRSSTRRLVPHAGPDSARFREVVRARRASPQRLGELRGSRVEAEVAILWDYQAAWAAERPGHAVARARLRPGRPRRVHRLLRDRGVTADVVHPGADLTAYALVVVPTLYLVTDEHAAADRRGRRGRRPGARHLLLRHQRRATTTCGSAATPARSATCSACGSRSSSRSLDGEAVSLVERQRPRSWSEDVTATSAPRSLSTYADGPLAGRPAVTRRDVGQRCGVVPQHPARRRHPRRAARRRSPRQPGWTPPSSVPPGVEVVRRRGADGSWLFLINDTDAEQRVDVTGHDLVTDRPVGPAAVLPPGGVAVVREA